MFGWNFRETLERQASNKGTKEENKYMVDHHIKENLNEEEYSHTWQRSKLCHQEMKES